MNNLITRASTTTLREEKTSSVEIIDHSVTSIKPQKTAKITKIIDYQEQYISEFSAFNQTFNKLEVHKNGYIILESSKSESLPKLRINVFETETTTTDWNLNKFFDIYYLEENSSFLSPIGVDLKRFCPSLEIRYKIGHIIMIISCFIFVVFLGRIGPWQYFGNLCLITSMSRIISVTQS